VVEIGKRVSAFKKFIKKKEVMLKEFWKQWEDLQNEYIELGVEVFGPEIFGEPAASLTAGQKGFQREMELLDLEHNARVGEFDEEIEDTGLKILQKMKVSEKVCVYLLILQICSDKGTGVRCCEEKGASEAASSTHSRLTIQCGQVCHLLNS
jgi:hypothetical protein